VGGVIVSTQAKVDATDECDVVSRPVRMSDDDELLMMGSGAPGTGVQQHIAASLVDVTGELGVLALAAFEPVGLRPPDQPEDHNAGSGTTPKHVTDRSIGPVEEFLGVAAKVGEVDLIPALGSAQLLMQAAKVRGAVDERLDRVPGRPGADIRRSIAALGGQQKPTGRNVGTGRTLAVGRHADQCRPSASLPASNAERRVCDA